MTYKIKWYSLAGTAWKAETPFGDFLIYECRFADRQDSAIYATFNDFLVCNGKGYKSAEHAKKGCHRHFNSKLKACLIQEGE